MQTHLPVKASAGIPTLLYRIIKELSTAYLQLTIANSKPEGEKLGTFWGYTFGGIWQEDEVNAPFVDANGQTNGKTNGEVYKVVAGNSKYVDTNKDGVLNDADQGIIGCGQPTFNWGWNNSFNYKNFDFSFFMVGFHGFDIYNATHQMGSRSWQMPRAAMAAP